jgi:hypothetical protein
MLREFFPAALLAFDDLATPDVLELLGRAPGPVSAARLSTMQIPAALTRAHRRDVPTKAATIQAALPSRLHYRRGFGSFRMPTHRELRSEFQQDRESTTPRRSVHFVVAVNPGGSSSSRQSTYARGLGPST